MDIDDIPKLDPTKVPVWQKRQPVTEHRTHVIKVRVSDSELNLIKEKNPLGSVSRFMREVTLNAITQTESEKPKQKYSETERQTLIALSRIGTNLNQIAKAVNSDVKNLGEFDKAKLLILLLDMEKQLKELRPDDC